jgi:hypothetical protein
MKYFKSHSEFLNEAKLSAIHRAAKKGSYPVTVVVVSNGSVTKQEIVNTPAAVPAVFNELQKEYPGATINIESKTGETLFVESVLNEKLARGLKPLLKLGTTITKKAGEDALLDLSDKFDRIDDEYAGTIASHLDMAIELMQDGYAGDATKKLKQFNKACKDVLNGKDVGSAFESTITEGKFNKRSLMKAMKKDDGMIQLGNGQEYVIYAYDNGNDDNDDMWGDKTIFALDQDGEEHEIEYSDIVRYDESRKINLKQDHLSSEEYQMAKKLKAFDKEDWEWNSKSGLYDKIGESEINEGKFDNHVDLVKSLHFEMDPDVAEEMKIELGKRQGEINVRKQLEGGEYSLRRFRKEIKYDTTGKDLGVFRPGSYMAATSKLGDGPHKKAVKKVRWNQKMYDQWIEDVASNDGWKNAYDMAQNAKQESGLIDWVKKNNRGEDPMQRIQWDIEAHAE